MCLDGHFDALGLQQLSDVQKLRKILRHPVVLLHVTADAQIADPAALVRRHHGGFNVPILGQGVGFDRFQLRERLKPVLAHETPDVVVIRAERVLSMPDTPVVDVAIGGMAVGVFARDVEGRGGPIKHTRMVCADHRRQKFVKNGIVGIPDHPPLIHSVLLLPTPAHKFVVLRPGHVDFVVATPQRNAGVIAQAFDVVHRLLFHIAQEFWVTGVHATGKHEVLPNQHACFVAQIVKDVVFIKTAAPDAQHVHVGVYGGADEVPVFFGPHAGDEHVVGDVIGAFGKNGLAVEFKIKRTAFFIGGLDNFDGP